ncbi:MAG: bifunctional phosphopantothenoylcysteine decarboxylase/phosphopantothenate synthase, partial [Atopobiaceae bacterium]|nr:bifunctional phosphopantothenoylcysteine decarboxylase/phosphopantothenate synthase [Atopobiaceae bacterium]
MSESRAARVLIVVSGGIAAYKACEVLRGLQKAGCEVRVVMTQDATKFVGTVTFEALSGHPVGTSLYGFPESPIPHIMLSEWADLTLVVPATGNLMAKMVSGLADDLASATLLAAASPVLVAPAMNVRMWENPATVANVKTLSSRGISFVMPTQGRLACGDVGTGKLADVDDIVSAALALLAGKQLAAPAVVSDPVTSSTSEAGILEALSAAAAASGGAIVVEEPVRDLEGWRFLITAGPTHEAIDPVRFIANASTGKMGYTIARRAAERGAQVTIVSGPVSLAAPDGVDVVRVTSAAERYDAATKRCGHDVDCAICTAAVADYTPARPADHKLKKGIERIDVIELVETKDILAALSRMKD